MSAGSTGVPVSYLSAVADTIRDEALAATRARLAAHGGIGLDGLLARPEFCEALKVQLVAGVARALACNDPRVLAVYTYNPSDSPGGEAGESPLSDPVLHLLVLVPAPSAGSQAFLAALDRALTASLTALCGPVYAGRESVLDAHLLSEEDVRHGTGYAVLLSSTFAPALKVWARN